MTDYEPDPQRSSLEKPTEHVAEAAVPRASAGAGHIAQSHADLYAEALAKYGVDGDIDPAAEKRVKRKLDMRILLCLGICYFFYVSYIRDEEERCGVGPWGGVVEDVGPGFAVHCRSSTFLVLWHSCPPSP